MPEGQDYVVQYRIPGEREFSDIDPDPSDIRTLQDAEKRFQVDNGKSGTEVRLVKVSRYLTLDGRLAFKNTLSKTGEVSMAAIADRATGVESTKNLSILLTFTLSGYTKYFIPLFLNILH
jgi:hypothetical protein